MRTKCGYRWYHKRVTVTEADRKIRDRGRPRRGDNPAKFSVTLPFELGQWGKSQPGGLSGLLSRLLEEEKKRQEAATVAQQ